MARQPGGQPVADTDENDGDGDVGDLRSDNKVPILAKGQTPSKEVGCPCHS